VWRGGGGGAGQLKAYAYCPGRKLFTKIILCIIHSTFANGNKWPNKRAALTKTAPLWHTAPLCLVKTYYISFVICYVQRQIHHDDGRSKILQQSLQIYHITVHRISQLLPLRPCV